MRRILYVAAAALMASSLYAATPALVYVSYVDYSPHPIIGNVHGAVTRANGGILFADAYDDWVIQVATPLTSDGTNNNAANSWGAFQLYDSGTSTYWFESGTSMQGLCYDGTHYYACGAYNSSNTCVLTQLTDPNNGNPYTGVKMTVSPDGRYSGCTAVSTDTLVMADYATGALQFFSVSGSTATATGSAIANTNNTDSYFTTQVVYYESGATKKLFTFMAKDNSTRRIDVFDTDGTPAGTSYAGTFCSAITSNFTLDYVNGLKYCNLAVNPDRQILIAAAAIDTTGDNGYDVFDLSSIPTDGSATPYQQIRDNTMNNGGSNHLTAGAAFFSDSGKDYVGLTNSNRLHVYQLAPASVPDWQLF